MNQPKWVFTKISCLQGKCSYITSSESGTVYCVFNDEVWNASFEPYRVYKSNANSLIKGITWCRDNKFYMCVKNQILEYDLITKQSCVLAGTGNLENVDGSFQDASFEGTCGIVMNKKGDLFVADDYCLRKLDMKQKTVNTIAGTEYTGHNDGEALSAEFEKISSIVITDDNTIYVCDYMNHCIRKIKDNMVSTIAGIPSRAGGTDGKLSKARFEYPSSMAWDKTDNILFVVDSNSSRLRLVDLNRKIVTTEEITSRFCVGNDYKGNILLATSTEVILIENLWKYERLLWIANKKEDTTVCPAASLPGDLIKEIMSYLYFGDGEAHVQYRLL